MSWHNTIHGLEGDPPGRTYVTDAEISEVAKDLFLSRAPSLRTIEMMRCEILECWEQLRETLRNCEALNNQLLEAQAEIDLLEAELHDAEEP